MIQILLGFVALVTVIVFGYEIYSFFQLKKWIDVILLTIFGMLIIGGIVVTIRIIV